jgi:hypothetical protein
MGQHHQSEAEVSPTEPMTCLQYMAFDWPWDSPESFHENVSIHANKHGSRSGGELVTRVLKNI